MQDSPEIIAILNQALKEELNAISSISSMLKESTVGRLSCANVAGIVLLPMAVHVTKARSQLSRCRSPGLRSAPQEFAVKTCC